MTFVAAYRARRLAPTLAAHRAQEEAVTPATVAARQLVDLNEAWAASLASSPWAQAIRNGATLPERFASWDEFDSRVPVMDKARLRPLIASVMPGANSNATFRATGGSTGEPFRFPVWPQEAAGAGLTIWLGRARLGISPSDPLFLLWGHAHLLGRGRIGLVNKLKRRFSDRLLGYTRVSAYALSPDALRRAGDRLLARRSAYAVGYASALDRFARVNSDRADDFARLRLKAVIATAEAFPLDDSREVVAHTFGAPVAMEYGSVETGPLAYEGAGSGGSRVFATRYRLSRRGGPGPAADELLVTSLYPRAMPLLRYALGDLVRVEPSDVADGSILHLSKIVGRCNDIVMLPTGTSVHSEAFTHCVRDVAGLEAFQVVAEPGAWPRLRYTAHGDLPVNSISEVRRRLAVIDPGLAETRLERVAHLPLSVAGKHRMVVEK